MDSTLLSSMEPGSIAVRSWIPKTTKNTFPDSLTIYDAGNIQGFLVKEASGKTSWIVFQVDYKILQEDGCVTEGCEILPESSAPLNYFSIETYPLRIESYDKNTLLYSIPETQILMSYSRNV